MSRPRVPTLRKAAELLELFSHEQPTWRLRDVALAVGWDKSTAYRILEALVDCRFLDRTPDGEYQVGVLPLELGAVYLSTDPVRRLLVSEVQRIADASGLTTQLGVLDGARVAIVTSHEGTSPVKAAAMLGQRLPLHASAAGKAILAQLADEELDGILPDELEPYTARTITSRDALLAAVAIVRESGVAVAEGELAEGLDAVAVPLGRGRIGTTVAALTCAGPPAAVMPAAWETARAALQEVARRMDGIGMGGSVWSRPA